MTETPVKLYLAGPMRGYPEFNFPAFRDARLKLRAEGYEVFCPAERDEAIGLDPTGALGELDELVGFDLREALGVDLAYITQEADAIAVLPGWADSFGARAEVATAVALGLPVVDADSLRPLNVRFEVTFSW